MKWNNKIEYKNGHIDFERTNFDSAIRAITESEIKV